MRLPESQVQRLAAVLSATYRVPPWWMPHERLPNGRLIERPRDPILTTPGLPKYQDHREYSLRMVTDGLGEPWQKLVGQIRGHPISIVPARRESPAARVLADYGAWLWDSMEQSHLPIVTAALDAYRWGWRPLQIRPALRTTWQQQTVYIPVTVSAGQVPAVVPHELHQFAWTAPEAEVRTLVHRPMLWAGTREIPDDDLSVGWAIARSQSVEATDDPYGRGLWSIVYVPWLLLHEVVKRSAIAVERGLGALQVTVDDFSLEAPESGAGWLSAYKSELEDILDAWNSENILWLRSKGLKVSPIEGISSMVDDVGKFEDRLRLVLRRTILGNTLTTSMEGSQGSRAATQVHQDEQAGLLCDVTSEIVEPTVRQVIAASIRLNLDEQVDPDDLPRAVSAIHQTRRVSKLREYVDLGGALDEQATARALGIEDLVHLTGQPLNRPAAPSLEALLGTPPARSLGRRELAAGVDAAADAERGDLRELPGQIDREALAGRARQLVDRYRQERPDPKGPSRRQT